MHHRIFEPAPKRSSCGRDVHTRTLPRARATTRHARDPYVRVESHIVTHTHEVFADRFVFFAAVPRFVKIVEVPRMDWHSNVILILILIEIRVVQSND